MDAVLIEPAQTKEWERYIAGNPESTAWQSCAWNDVLKKHYPVTFYPIAALDDSGIRGILPLYHVRTRLKKDALISVPYAVAGGILADDAEASATLLAEAVRIAERHRGCRIALKQYKSRVQGELLTDDNYYNRELTLHRDTDALFDSFEDSNKRAIEESYTLTYDFEYPSRDTDGFFDVLFGHHHRRGVPCVSKRWIDDLLSSGMYSIALLRRGTFIESGTMIKEYKDTISFPFTCVCGREGR